MIDSVNEAEMVWRFAIVILQRVGRQDNHIISTEWHCPRLSLTGVLFIAHQLGQPSRF